MNAYPARIITSIISFNGNGTTEYSNNPSCDAYIAGHTDIAIKRTIKKLLYGI